MTSTPNSHEPTDVATITPSVVRRFPDPAPLPRKPDIE